MSPAGMKKLRTILVRSGALTEEQADTFYATALRERRPLSSVIVRAGALSEHDLLGVVARAAGTVPVDLQRLRFDEDAKRVVPQETAVSYGVFPISKLEDVLTIAVSNPFDVMKLDDLRLVTGCTLRLVLSTEDAIRAATSRVYSEGRAEMEQLVGEVEGKTLELAEAPTQEEGVDLDALSSEESPVVKIVNLLIFEALRVGASDIHIEPFEKRLRVRYRVDGVLREVPSPPKGVTSAIVTRIKIMARLDIAEKVKPQDGKFQIRYEGRTIDFRVSVLPVTWGEKIVCRILDTSALSLSLDSLGFEPKAFQDVDTSIHRPYGMVLVTGPTGSGKSTTLYAAVRRIVKIETNIVTVEDPVEYTMEGVNQVPINPKRGVTFASALRAILRQDPNTILIGEIRDTETLDIAVKAALTGHLVLSTLHTNDAPSTMTRMTDMGCDPFLVASSVLVVAAQRLLRTLCTGCREPAEVTPERLREVGYGEEELAKVTLYRAAGCPRCNLGYRGRFALLETMPITEPLKRMIVERRSAEDLRVLALAEGMLTLRRCGLSAAAIGRTSLEEVLRVTMPDGAKPE